MTANERFPLDLQRTTYSYIERHNATVLALLERHVLGKNPSGAVLDIGCGAGANGRAVRAKWSSARLQGVEPNARAATLAREVYDDVFNGYSSAWLETRPEGSYDAVVLSDVLEHIPDPVSFLKELAAYEGVRNAAWIISIPNYAVWYNRVKTLFGKFEYAWSGLYDRTHLRFFTRSSIRELLDYTGFEVVDDGCTPSMVQSMAPILRRFFESDVKSGDHLTLPKSKAFATYEAVVEPTEAQICSLWPELLGFQIVTVARLRSR